MSDLGATEHSPLLVNASIVELPHTAKATRKGEHWENAPRGNIIHHDEPLDIAPPILNKHKLGQLPATSISGNDITSSCLYVAGICVQSSGKFAPISLFLVAIVLYLFRNVYAEVGSALPLNGGAYNVLLNTTSKTVAALAAALTLLSYVATAVVSGSEAMEYAQDLYYKIDPFWATAIVLGVFAVLNIIGITESSVVATVIFLFHCTSLIMLIIACTIFAFKDNWQILKTNWQQPPLVSVPYDVFFGFCSGLLGVSGFETSANFIEEQAPGVFPKTLRNMWAAVAFFNPVISLLSLAMLPVNEIVADQRIVLSIMGKKAAGPWLGYVISADATLVLSGAVLTAFVGVTGLVHRMALDRLLPDFLLHKNSCRKTNHWIIIGFFLLTTSLYYIVNGNVNTLSGVYTVAFLSVMSLFAVGNMLLKYKRSKLPRTNKTRWFYVLFALLSVLAALVGNIMYNVQVLQTFAIYFGAAMTVVFTMMGRVNILRMIYFFVSKVRWCGPISDKLKEWIHQIRDLELIFYTKNGELATLNKAMMYVRDNEQSNKLTIIHVYESPEKIPPKLQKHVAIMDEVYPKFSVNLRLYRGQFSPEFCDAISKALHVQKNYMFMGCPNDKFPHNIGEFGGIRLITH